MQGADTTAIPRMLAEGAVGIKAFMCGSDPSYPGSDDAQLLRALHALRDTPFMLGVHAENDALLTDGIATMRAAGRRDPLAHAESRPPIVEIEAVNRAILLAEQVGAWVHIVHMSTAGAADLVAAAKARGARVTCETCPQYLALDEDDLVRLGPLARCAPPLRGREHVEALWDHLAAGTIDCVTTDHCGYSYESRLPGHEDIFEAPNGLPGVQTLLPVVITEARRRGFAWEDIARLLAGAPARLWRLAPRKGTITVGADADLVLWDPHGAGRFAVAIWRNGTSGRRSRASRPPAVSYAPCSAAEPCTTSPRARRSSRPPELASSSLPSRPRDPGVDRRYRRAACPAVRDRRRGGSQPPGPQRRRAGCTRPRRRLDARRRAGRLA